MNLKPIRSEKDYAEAVAESERLWNSESGTPDRDRLEVLSMLVDLYEREAFPIDPPDPIEAIKFRLEQQGLARKDLLPIFGRTGRISEIFSGARPLTLTMVYQLHTQFGIPYESLISPKKAKKPTVSRARDASGRRRVKKASKQRDVRASG